MTCLWSIMTLDRLPLQTSWSIMTLAMRLIPLYLIVLVSFEESIFWCKYLVIIPFSKYKNSINPIHIKS